MGDNGFGIHLKLGGRGPAGYKGMKNWVIHSGRPQKFRQSSHQIIVRSLKEWLQAAVRLPGVKLKKWAATTTSLLGDSRNKVVQHRGDLRVTNSKEGVKTA